MIHAQKQITIFTVTLAMCALSCGTRQPPQEIKPPEPVLAKARTCPGALVGPNIQVTTAIGESNAPVITWAKDVFAIAWWDLRGRFPEVRVIRVDRNGVPRSPAQRIPNKGAARNQSLVWDGQEIHVVWTDSESIMSTRLAATAPEPKVLAQTGVMPAAGAWGTAVWVDKSGKLLFRSDGMIPRTTKGPAESIIEPVVLATGGIESPQVAFNGEIYVVVWSSSVKGGREILLQRVSPKGRKLGSVVRVSATAGISRKPVVVWSGDNFAVAWTNAAPAAENPLDRFRVFFALVPEVGDAPTMTRQLDFKGSADQVALAATGKEFGLAWVGSRKPVGTAVYLQRISLTGEPLEETTEVTDGVPLTCGRPSLAWDGEGYAVVWHDDRAQTGSEVFFAYVECGEEIEIPAPPGQKADATQDAGPDAAHGGHNSPQAPAKVPVLKEAFDGSESKKK